jgi:hypothetical protein
MKIRKENIWRMRHSTAIRAPAETGFYAFRV